jgi:hypothetical protein
MRKQLARLPSYMHNVVQGVIKAMSAYNDGKSELEAAKERTLDLVANIFA